VQCMQNKWRAEIFVKEDVVHHLRSLQLDIIKPKCSTSKAYHSVALRD